MKPTDFRESNFTFTAPKGMDNCGALKVWKGEDQSISCWEMEGAEKLLALLTGRVWLGVCGQGHPPVWVSGSSPFPDATGNFEDSDEEFLRHSVGAAIRERIAAFDEHCFREGMDFTVDGAFTKDELLKEFAKFLFNIETSDKKE